MSKDDKYTTGSPDAEQQGRGQENRELQWAENAARDRDQIRKEIYLERNTDLLMRRHTRDESDPRSASKASRDRTNNLMLLAVGSPAYMEAYNNQLTFNIGGEELEITQGSLFEISGKYAEDLRAQIGRAKRGNLDAADLALMTAELEHVEAITEIADPQHGKMTPEQHQMVQEHLRQSPGLQQELKEEIGFSDSLTATTDSYRAEFQSQENISAGKSTSFADSIEPSPLDAVAAKPTAEFNLVAQNTPDSLPEPERQPTPGQNSGFNL